VVVHPGHLQELENLANVAEKTQWTIRRRHFLRLPRLGEKLQASPFPPPGKMPSHRQRLNTPRRRPGLTAYTTFQTRLGMQSGPGALERLTAALTSSRENSVKSPGHSTPTSAGSP